MKINVQTDDPNGRGFGGSGTAFVSDGQWTYIVTCKHVAEGPKGQTVYMPDQRGHKRAVKVKQYLVTFNDNARYVDATPIAADFVAADLKADLAILKIQGGAKFPTIPVASRSPRAGDNIVQVGYPAPDKQREFSGGLTQRSGSVRGFRSNMASFHSMSEGMPLGMVPDALFAATIADRTESFARGD